SGDALERVPQLGIAARLLVGREVAFEHAAFGAEGLDARLEILPPRCGEVGRGRRQVALVKVEAERGHADAAELDDEVRAFREFGDVLLPAGEDLSAVADIRPDAKDPADMIEDDRRLGEGAGEVDRVLKLRVILPGFEAETERSEFGEALAEFRVPELMRRD